MGYAFTEDQEFFRDTVAKIFEREMDFSKRQKLVAAGEANSAPVWAAFAEAGLLGLPIPEARGGMGGSAMDVAAVSEVMGRRMSVEPYVSTVLLGGLALALSPASPERDAILEGVIAGEEFLALAHEEGHGTVEPARVAMTAARAGEGWILSGVKRLALGADVAGHLVVSARTSGAPGDPQGVALFLVPTDAAGVSAKAYRTIDGRTGAHLVFADVELPAPALLTGEGDGLPLLTEVLARGQLALAAEAVGAMEALLAATADYANQRKQFGVAIGTFQALRHRIADMWMAHQRARATLLVTAAMIDAGEAEGRHVSLLRAQVGRLGRKLSESAVQVHGGMGTTDELDVGHNLKRVLAAATLFGTALQHQRVVGRSMGRSRNVAEAV